MSAGLCNLDLKNSYLSSMTFSKHLKNNLCVIKIIVAACEKMMKPCDF